MHLRHVANPNAKSAAIFGAVGAVGLFVGIAGFLMTSDTGLAVGITGLIVGLTCGITAPLLYSTGRKQVGEIHALIGGQDLLAHWAFDPDEWQRYTANEYSRGMKETRTVSIWTFAIVCGLALLGELFAGALTGLMIGVAVAMGAVFAALLGGFSYMNAKSAHAANLKGVGEVFIGGTCIYFGTRFYTWQGRWAALEKVAFEAGDPSVVQFNVRYGAGDNASHVEVRIPVPRGCEEEAESLVASYYAAS